MKNIALALIAAACFSTSAFAADYAMAVKIKGGCANAASGSCTVAVSGFDGSVALQTSATANGPWAAGSKAFTVSSEGTNKRIANNNYSCVRAVKAARRGSTNVSASDRSRAKCF